MDCARPSAARGFQWKVPLESDAGVDLSLVAGSGFPRSSLSFYPTVLNFSVDLDLHPEDEIHITACGFEANTLHRLMGKDGGLTWAQINNPMLTEKQRREIMEDLIEEALDKNWLGIPERNLQDENEPLGLFSAFHSPQEASESPFEKHLDKRDYRLAYTIEAV